MNYQERLLLELKEKLGASDYPTKTLADELHPAVFESIIQEAAKSGGITAGSILDAMIRAKNKWILDETGQIVPVNSKRKIIVPPDGIKYYTPHQWIKKLKKSVSISLTFATKHTKYFE